MTVIKYEKDQSGIVTLLIDMPGAVNVMNNDFTNALIEALEGLAKETDVTGVVLASGKNTFFAGGDVKVMAGTPQGYNDLLTKAMAHTRHAIRLIEKLKVPVVAAINGAALGGGYELTLACNHRIAWDDKSVLLGLPESNLGLLPGGGGIVRLVKKFGLQRAVPYLLNGTILQAAQALEAGLIDEAVSEVSDLVPRAKAWIIEHKNDPKAAMQPWDLPGYKIPGGDLSEPAVRAFISATSFRLYEETRGLIPNKPLILDIAVEAVKLDLDTALRIEGRGLVTLLLSAVPKNMMSANFFQKNAIKRGLSRPKQHDRSRVTTLGIIGAGAVGAGIAHAAALAGIRVVLSDVSEERAQEGKTSCESLHDETHNEATRELIMSRITPTGKLADLEGSDLVIEALPETLSLKCQVIAEAAGKSMGMGIFGTSTSVFPISELAANWSDPSQFIGLHFLSPVPKSEIVEVIFGRQTSDETLAKAFDFVRQIGKTPIVVKDEPGFYTSRIISSQLWEAAQLVAEGVHPVRVDNLGKAIGLHEGPLTLHDRLGQRSTLLALDDQRALRPPVDGDPRPQGTALISYLVASGRGGKNCGGGYYDHSTVGTMVCKDLVEKYYRPQLQVLDQDVKDRLLFSAVIESLACLQEGVLQTVAEANIGALQGAGAPTWTGGYIQFINTYGLQLFVDRCNELAAKYGERFKATAMVSEKLAAGGTFT